MSFFCCKRRQQHDIGGPEAELCRKPAETKSVDNKYEFPGIGRKTSSPGPETPSPGPETPSLGPDVEQSLERVVRTLDEIEAVDTEESSRINMKIHVTQALDNVIKKRTMIDERRLKLGKTIGEGKFGRVFEGKLSRKQDRSLGVAVKTINISSCTMTDIEQFLDESLCMCGFHHKNVLSVIGLCIKKNRPYIIMPIMVNGDLKKYVANKIRTFTMKDLLGYIAHVAEGMNYLQEQGFIHRDLAARNCVVSGDDVVKVADFGLSRDIFVDEYYRITNMDIPLPVRWMAVESLMSQIFTHKSDVWSFGVLMWEVLTRGREPYPGMDNVAVIIDVRNGRRLDQPSHVPDNIFSIMEKCWRETPKNRPDFEDLSNMLNHLLKHSNLERHSCNTK